MTKSISNLRFGLYARKSTESDERQVESIDDQFKAMEEVATRESLAIEKRYSESHSAKAPNTRGPYYEMIKDIKSGVIDAILCWSFDRLSRNPVDSGDLSWMLQEEVLKLIKTPIREYHPEDNVVILAVEGASANQQIIELRRNVKRGLGSKAERGIWPHMPPAGYRSAEIIINNRTRHKVEVDTQRFLLLRKAWDLMLTGAYTVPQIQERLNAWGYRSRKTKKGRGLRPMSRTGLYSAFRNPFYYGSYWYTGTFFKGNHKPMVSKQEFDEVQRLLGRKGNIQPQKQEFAFTGMIRCGICRGMVTAERHVKHYKTTGNTRHYVYYHCCGKGCRQSVSEAYIDEQIASFLAKCKINSDLVETIEGVLSRDLEDHPITGSTIHNERRIRMDKFRQRLDMLFEMREGNEITATEFANRKALCVSEINAIEGEVQQAHNQREQLSSTLRNGADFFEHAYQDFIAGGIREKRQAAMLLSRNYTLTLGRLEIEPNPVLDALRSLEPPKGGRNKVRKQVSMASQSAVSASLNHILTLIKEEDYSFPSLRPSSENKLAA